jgi:hypothetical protein
MLYNIEKVRLPGKAIQFLLIKICLFIGECFDADDDNGRICGSITPDTVLYTLFRGKKEIKLKKKKRI